MRKAVAAGAGLLLLPLLSGSALAQEERYRLERTQDGYVRMDTQTGAMTLCQERSGELVCRPASESRAGGPSEMAALRDRIAALEDRVTALEGGTDSRLPLEQEFEQSLSLMERFFRRFVDIVRGLEEEQREQPAESEPPASGGRT
jgi:hypothetical protein